MAGLHHFLAAGLVLGSACSTPGTPPSASATPRPPSVPGYEVHEWGLVRGASGDRVMLSGPHAPEPVLAVTKPVLYFHRHGDGVLRVDVEAHVPNGRIVEHWPSLGGAPGSTASWPDVLIQGDACPGSRYPTLAEDPCRALGDGCESATLASVETTDANCLYWPRPPGDDGPTQAWNHLFYRGEVDGAQALPLRAEPGVAGTLRLTTTGTSPIPGRVLRIRRTYGALGMNDAIAIVTPPAPGASAVVDAPTGPLSSGRAALADTLRTVGLTTQEIDAFERAWNDELFGAVAGSQRTESSTVATTTPTLPTRRRPTTSILYVLPAAAADALAMLRFDPAPTVVRRAIVVWIDETAMR